MGRRNEMTGTAEQFYVAFSAALRFSTALSAKQKWHALCIVLRIRICDDGEARHGRGAARPRGAGLRRHRRQRLMALIDELSGAA